MLSKNNDYLNLKKTGKKYEKYSIKKLKVGAASVLVGAGFFLGFHVEASEINEPATNEVVSSSPKDQNEKTSEAPKAIAEIEETTNQATSSVDNQLIEEKNTNFATEKATLVEEKPSIIVEKAEQLTDEKKDTVEKSHLAEKMTALQEQVDRIRSNEKQKSFIEKAEKLLEEAKALQTSSTATQTEVDKKAKELSSLTSILKSIKAEEMPKENKNQDSRNGKKMEEGTGFRTGVTDHALFGAVHFDSADGPSEKNIPVIGEGSGKRRVNVSITYTTSSTDTVVDGKVRVTIPKALLHTKKTEQPTFIHSSLVKNMIDRSTESDYIYEIVLKPMSGGTVTESKLNLTVGTSIKNSPSKNDTLPIKAEYIIGNDVLSTETATATFDYLSEIIYKENDQREKTIESYTSRDEREFKFGIVTDGNLKMTENATFRVPLIMSSRSFFSGQDVEFENGNGRLTSYDYTISGIPDFLELDPKSVENNRNWTLENGILKLHHDIEKGGVKNLYESGAILKVKEGVLNTQEGIAKVIESNNTRGYVANLTYTAIGHRPDGSTFTQTLSNPRGFRFYAGDGVSTIGNLYKYINTSSKQRLYSEVSNIDNFTADLGITTPKYDESYLPSQYINYFIPKDKEGNYFSKFSIKNLWYNEITETSQKTSKILNKNRFDSNLSFKEKFKLYGVGQENQAELIKEYTSVEELFKEIKLNPEKRYTHLILKHPGIVDKYNKVDEQDKKIAMIQPELGVTVGTWEKMAKDPSITRYENKIFQSVSAENTLESAVNTERPATGTGKAAIHTKEWPTLKLRMEQFGNSNLTKNNLSRGQSIPMAVVYEAPDYFGLVESIEDGKSVYDLNKLDSKINKPTLMLLADSNVPMKNFRLLADNRLVTSSSFYIGGTNNSGGEYDYNRVKENYNTVNPSRIIENYKNTGKRAYLFDYEDLGISSYEITENIKGDGNNKPAVIAFEVENNGQVTSGTYPIESYLVWNSDSDRLIGADRSINADYVEGHEAGATIAKANTTVTFVNNIEYSISLTIAKPGTPGVRGIIDVKNGQEVTLTPRVENLTDTPQKVKEAIVLIPKTEAVTYLEGPISEDSPEFDVLYTTTTNTDKKTANYVTKDQITDWKAVTAVKYVFKDNYTISKEHGFTHHFNLRVDNDNANFIQSTSQVFIKNNEGNWADSNKVGLVTEDIRGKLIVKYINEQGYDVDNDIITKEFAGTEYTTSKKDFVVKSGKAYLFKEIRPDSARESGVYEKQVTKKVVYIYEEATISEETQTLTRTINYLEKDNDSNVVSPPQVQSVTVKRKVYTGKDTGRVVKGDWIIEKNTNWEAVTFPTLSDWENPQIKANDQYVPKTSIDKVAITPEVVSNGDVVENVYYERFVPVGGDVVAKYVIKGTTTELKQATDVAKGLKVGSTYTATAPQAGEVLKQGELEFILEGRKADSAAETGKVTADNQEIIYEYVPKQGGTVIAKYVIKGETTELKPSTTVSTGAQVGSEYTATAPQVGEVLKQGELEYVLEGRKADSAAETGKVTADNQEIIYEYVPKQGGNVEVKYVIAGTGEILKNPVTLVTNGQVGTDYDTTTLKFKFERIEKDGKVYILTAKTKPGSAEEKGKVTEQPQSITYVYEEVPEHESKQKYGNVIVTYVDKSGRPLSGTTETGVKINKSVIDMPASLVKTPYDTTDNKPETITTADGKVYKFVKVTQHSDAEISDVKSRTSVITYVYELVNTTEKLPEAHIGFVVVNYVDVDGLPISGTSEGKEIPTTVMDVNGDLVGTQYDTTDHKPTTITTANGDVYEFVKKSESSAPESGDLKEGVTTVEYVYRKVVTTYVDENGKEINPSEKGTKDKKDISEYIHKETKKDDKGNTIHVYRQVVTTYVDETGKEINPSDKGTKDKKEISGYTFKETKKDKDGNTVHVYRKKQSSTPENPTPETPNTDKSTIWKSVDGETLKPRENDTKDKTSIPGYEFVRTEKDKEGNTVHIYRKVTSSTPEVNEKETSYVDENGKEIRSTKKGKQPKENIPGYEFVRTEEDSNGNLRHVYRQVVHSEITVDTPTNVQEHKNELPNTGTGDEFTIFGAAAASILAGLGIAIPGKKKEN